MDKVFWDQIIQLIDECSSKLYTDANRCYEADGSSDMMTVSVLDNFHELRNKLNELKDVYQG